MTDPVEAALDALRKAVLSEQSRMAVVARLDFADLERANATIEKLRGELVESVKHANRLEGEIARMQRLPSGGYPAEPAKTQLRPVRNVRVLGMDLQLASS